MMLLIIFHTLFAKVIEIDVPDDAVVLAISGEPGNLKTTFAGNVGKIQEILTPQSPRSTPQSQVQTQAQIQVQPQPARENIILYTRKNCGNCTFVKSTLKRDGIPFEEKNVDRESPPPRSNCNSLPLAYGYNPSQPNSVHFIGCGTRVIDTVHSLMTQPPSTATQIANTPAKGKLAEGNYAFTVDTCGPCQKFKRANAGTHTFFRSPDFDSARNGIFFDKDGNDASIRFSQYTNEVGALRSYPTPFHVDANGNMTSAWPQTNTKAGNIFSSVPSIFNRFR